MTSTHRIALVLALLFLPACRTVAETGRRQVTFFPEAYVNTLGAQAYASETSKFPVIETGRDAEMVQRVGARIAAASGRDYEWEFLLLDAPDVVNAFALPGGKVAIYSGILPVTQNEDGLAAVLGHEVAHATSGHGNERMSQQVLAQGAVIAADAALEGWTDLDETERQGWVDAFGMATELGAILPFSRHHESEADEIGLRFLIRAGYDPYEAPRLWERMAKLAGESPNELLSTHPDPLDRALRLRRLIPDIAAQEGLAL